MNRVRGVCVCVWDKTQGHATKAVVWKTGFPAIQQPNWAKNLQFKCNQITANNQSNENVFGHGDSRLEPASK